MGKGTMMGTSAAILAGGLGTRLRPAVSDRPKVLAEVNGRPFLAFLLDQLIRSGVENAVLCIGHLGQQVVETFGDAYRGLKLRYSVETFPLGTGGGLRAALPLMGSDPVLVLNGDSYIEADLGAFLAWHRARRASASVLLVKHPEGDRYGQVKVDADGHIRRFAEKGARRGTGLINAGVYLLPLSVLQVIPPNCPISLERDVLAALVGHGLYGYSAAGPFIDIGTPASYQEAGKFFASMQ